MTRALLLFVLRGCLPALRLWCSHTFVGARKGALLCLYYVRNCGAAGVDLTPWASGTWRGRTAAVEPQTGCGAAGGVRERRTGCGSRRTGAERGAGLCAADAVQVQPTGCCALDAVQVAAGRGCCALGRGAGQAGRAVAPQDGAWL